MNLSLPDLLPRSNLFLPFPPVGEREIKIGSHARRAGAEVKRLLSSPSLSGKVLAHLPGILYLTTDQEDLFWVSVEPFPMHRRCLQVSYLPLPHLVRSGERFQLRGSALGIGSSFFIGLSSYTEWASASVYKKKPRLLAELWLCGKMLNRHITRLNSAKGLGQALPLILAMAEEEEGPPLSADSVWERMLTPLLGVAKACLRRDLDAVLGEGENLAGLGPGLTPSGDDFLGGLFFMLHSLNSAYPEKFPWNQERIIDFIGRAKSKTHPLSHAFLNDFASGHAPAPFHEVVRALIFGDLGEAFSAAASCIGLGHSSGWDVLSGLLTGMLMVPTNQLHS